MPLINMYLAEGTSSEYRAALTEGIHRAMVDVLGIPEDDYFHVTHELKPENLRYDPNYFGVPRGDGAVLIRLSFNARAAVTKQNLFEAIADRLTVEGLRREDLFMTIVETVPENWWAAGRSIDEKTGTDSRMAASA